jgi:hypothetical protein
LKWEMPVSPCHLSSCRPLRRRTHLGVTKSATAKTNQRKAPLWSILASDDAKQLGAKSGERDTAPAERDSSALSNNFGRERVLLCAKRWDSNRRNKCSHWQALMMDVGYPQPGRMREGAFELVGFPKSKQCGFTTVPTRLVMAVMGTTRAF